MPPEISEEKDIEVAVPEIKKGSVQFMNKAAFNNPAPEKMVRILSALSDFCAAMVTTVGATDLFTGRQPKIICFILGAAMVAFRLMKGVIGVKPSTDEK